MALFIKQAMYDLQVAKVKELQAQVTALETQLAQANSGVNAEQLSTLQLENTTLTGKVTSLTGEVETLTSQLEELNTANEALTTQVSALETSKTELNKEVEILRELPGAITATSTSKTENSVGDSVSTLDQVNEAIKNSDDVNANLVMLEKLGL